MHDDHVEAGTRASNQIFGHRSVQRIDCAAVIQNATRMPLRLIYEKTMLPGNSAGCLSDNRLENVVNLSQLPLEDFSRIASESSIEDEAMQAVTHPSTASGRAARLRAGRLREERSATRRSLAPPASLASEHGRYTRAA